MSRRYFSTDPITGPTARLVDAEAHHLLHVLRAKPGESVVLFDGRGAEYDAEVAACNRAEVELKVGPARRVSRELAATLAVGVALPKGDRTRWLVEKLVELGATRLVPLATQHSIAPNKPDAADKLRRYVIEASKQCGRNRLMEIAAPFDLHCWCTSADGAQKLIAHPGGRPLGDIDLGEAASTQIAIGPEGGFTDAEMETAVSAGWQVVDLGPRILRIETAAVVIAGAISQRSMRRGRV